MQTLPRFNDIFSFKTFVGIAVLSVAFSAYRSWQPVPLRTPDGVPLHGDWEFDLEKTIEAVAERDGEEAAEGFREGWKLTDDVPFFSRIKISGDWLEDTGDGLFHPDIELVDYHYHGNALCVQGMYYEAGFPAEDDIWPCLLQLESSGDNLKLSLWVAEGLFPELDMPWTLGPNTCRTPQHMVDQPERWSVLYFRRP